jgi:hypothetical protein
MVFEEVVFRNWMLLAQGTSCVKPNSEPGQKPEEKSKSREGRQTRGIREVTAGAGSEEGADDTQLAVLVLSPSSSPARVLPTPPWGSSTFPPL